MEIENQPRLKISIWIQFWPVTHTLNMEITLDHASSSQLSNGPDKKERTRPNENKSECKKVLTLLLSLLPFWSV